MTCKYKLLKGDAVEIYDLPKEMQDKEGDGLFGRKKDKAKTNIKISGDNMTMTDDDGKSCKLSRDEVARSALMPTARRTRSVHG